MPFAPSRSAFASFTRPDRRLPFACDVSSRIAQAEIAGVTAPWEAYGLAPDLVRIDYYRPLWKAT
jgi:hypothetical protein